MRNIRTNSEGQQYETLDGEYFGKVYYCRTCALKMYEANIGYGYRCAKCHEAKEGWC